MARVAVLLLGVALLVATDAAPAAGATPAAAVRGLSDGRVLASSDPATRAAGIRLAVELGARVARFPIAWNTVAAQGLRAPSEALLPLSDPAHPSYDWRRIDATMRDLSAAGLQPLAYFATAPAWAQSAPRYLFASIGTWAPHPGALAAFASAVARRYDGTYPDPKRPGQALPRLQHFQTWNEPNLSRYLEPQWIGTNLGRAELFSPRWYRRMHAAAYAAIHARQTDAVVGLAGLAPTGEHASGTARVEPLRFLRALLCTGAASQSCGSPLPFDAIAMHPLSTGNPDDPAQGADNLSVADLEPKLAAVLSEARRAGRLSTSAARAPLWITELNWTSADDGGVPAAKQVAVIGRAMLRLRQAGATVVAWQFATDPPPERTLGPRRPAGLTVPVPGDGRRLPGQPKQFLTGFRFPVAAIALSPTSAYVWAQPPATITGPRGRRVLQVDRWQSRGAQSGRRRARPGWVAAGRIVLGPTATSGAALVAVPRGARVRVRAGTERSASVRSVLDLGRVRADARRTAAEATRAQIRTTPAAPDPRPADPDGPGSFPPDPPLVPGGAPPAPNGRPIVPRALPPRRAPSHFVFTGSEGHDVLLGTTGDDRLLGLGGRDLLIGFGGDDRFAAQPGRDRVIRAPTAPAR